MAEIELNATDYKCIHCGSVVLLKGTGQVVANLSFDVPLMIQKKGDPNPKTEPLTKFCIVDRVDKFENVGVTRSTNGFVYLTCADCEMGPLGLQEPSNNSIYYVAIERVTSA